MSVRRLRGAHNPKQICEGEEHICETQSSIQYLLSASELLQMVLEQVHYPDMNVNL